VEVDVEADLVLQLFVIALFCGSTACWILKIDDALPSVLSAGLAGVYIEPWLRVTAGPKLFDHHLLACMAGAVIAAFLLGLAQSIFTVWWARAR
jgi:hypothetical protein